MKEADQLKKLMEAVQESDDEIDSGTYKVANKIVGDILEYVNFHGENIYEVDTQLAKILKAIPVILKRNGY